MLKQINPEDLKVGQECYIKVVTEKVKISDRSPVLRDIAGNFYYPSRGEPIYTLDDQPQKPDPELEMLVNVATALYVAHGTTANGVNTFMPDREEIAREAANLIAACKQIKEGER